MCLSVRFASSVAAAWSAGVAEHRFESQRNSRNVLSSSSETTQRARFSGEYSHIYRVENRIGKLDICEREREREDVCVYLRALRKSNMTTKPFSTHYEEEEVEEEDEDPRRLVS